MISAATIDCRGGRLGGHVDGTCTDPFLHGGVITQRRGWKDVDAHFPALLDGRPMVVLFDEHATAVQTEAAFRAAGRHFNKRLYLRTFLPGIQFVAAGGAALG